LIFFPDQVGTKNLNWFVFNQNKVLLTLLNGRNERNNKSETLRKDINLMLHLLEIAAAPKEIITKYKLINKNLSLIHEQKESENKLDDEEQKKFIDYNDFFKKETYVKLKLKIKILYGIINNYIDVTNICLQKINNNSIITIPHGDCNRTKIFSDPIYGTLKKIFILVDGELYEYDDTLAIKINLTGVFLSCQNFISHFHDKDIQQKIINIGSIYGSHSPHHNIYEEQNFFSNIKIT
jgi:hypothetical protein